MQIYVKKNWLVYVKMQQETDHKSSWKAKAVKIWEQLIKP